MSDPNGGLIERPIRMASDGHPEADDCLCPRCWAARERQSIRLILARLDADVDRAKARYGEHYEKAKPGYGR